MNEVDGKTEYASGGFHDELAIEALAKQLKNELPRLMPISPACTLTIDAGAKKLTISDKTLSVLMSEHRMNMEKIAMELAAQTVWGSNMEIRSIHDKSKQMDRYKRACETHPDLAKDDVEESLLDLWDTKFGDAPVDGLTLVSEPLLLDIAWILWGKGRLVIDQSCFVRVTSANIMYATRRRFR